MFRHPRCDIYLSKCQTKKQTKVEKSTKTEWCNAIHHYKIVKDGRFAAVIRKTKFSSYPLLRK